MITIATAPITTLFLVTIRLGTVLLITPIEAIRLLPIHTRLLLTLILSGLLVSNLNLSVTDVKELSLLISGVSEFCNGLILSLSLYAAFAVFQIAGQMIDTQMGLNSLAILNPSDHSHDSLSSRLLLMLATLFFFALNGHHQIIQGLALSFAVVAPGKLILFDGLSLIIKHFSMMFSFAIMLASPIIVSLLLVDMAGAVLTRNMPQISTYFLTLPIKIMLGLLVFRLLLNYINPIMSEVFEQTFHIWRVMMS